MLRAVNYKLPLSTLESLGMLIYIKLKRVRLKLSKVIKYLQEVSYNFSCE